MNPDLTPGMSAWYTAPICGIVGGGCQMLPSACPGLGTTSVTCLLVVNTGSGSSQAASTTRIDGYAWK